ncbi:uncharacterized protein (TIGR02246 family) [Kribbella amoyensis]|uniref:Uncharacterized protein (TIGR02246 family) n=1 Tax=Kribbella amoyensis TaxID=996641 RepID=A0A561BPM5_9ACTN|nr:nuclear transport factor 2 family protein [Kribbella amoyensis]TWD80814.1 uncharacterized protein (TIGR02246 family) [Kribbella amoyensis]
MTKDEQLIRDLIERWAAAVHVGDLDTVLAHHSDDVVMFDVPPPHDGVRGLDAYRATWPGFFEWQASGASFDLLSLDVTAGTDVAFAVALLRCGTADENPDNRLRLTIGLRKVEGEWVITHEHHSFPHDDIPRAVAESAVRDLIAHWSDRTAAKDLDGLMEGIADDVVSYEHEGPLQYVGKPAVREVCEAGLASGTGEVSFTVPAMEVAASNDLAVAWGIDQVTVETEDGPVLSESRATRVFRHGPRGWELVHQHLSFPR